jgi:hypothetical protein
VNPFELFTKEGKPANIWACGVCRFVAKTQEIANKCCTCQSCGKGLPNNCFECDDCSKARVVQWEKQRFEKAKKVKFEEYDGVMIFDGDDYHQTDEYFDHLEYVEGEAPEYVWATKACYLREFFIDDFYDKNEDFFEDWQNDLKGVEELEAALKKFNDLNKDLKSYEVDYKTAILI